MLRHAAVTLALLTLGAHSAAAEPPQPGPFYDPGPLAREGRPGEVLRAEPMVGAPAESAAYKILYRSTDPDGRPIAVSGVVIVPETPAPAGGRPVVAWAHPTTGVAPRCAPSLRGAGMFQSIPGLPEMLAQGWVVTATDYPGLGTPGPHPYLVGPSEGRAVLDSVRAARRLPGANASARFVTWGHSQGGHASLFAGELAKSYAPDLELLGVAAAAPATDLKALLEDDIKTDTGHILTAFSIWSWTNFYKLPADAVILPTAVPAIEDIADDCIESFGEDYWILQLATPLQKGMLKGPLWNTPPWDKLLAQNSPGEHPQSAPLFISQGTNDKVVRPTVTVDYVNRVCRQGTKVRILQVSGATHTTIPRQSEAAAVEWMAERFAGAPGRWDC